MLVYSTVVEWLRCCSLKPKIAGSRPARVVLRKPVPHSRCAPQMRACNGRRANPPTLCKARHGAHGSDYSSVGRHLTVDIADIRWSLARFRVAGFFRPQGRWKNIFSNPVLHAHYVLTENSPLRRSASKRSLSSVVRAMVL